LGHCILLRQFHVTPRVCAHPLVSGPQVHDHNDVDAIRQGVAALDNSRVWVNMPRHASAGDKAHKVSMAGNPCVTTDNGNFAGG
jgi:hypothetical protein